MSNSTQPTSLAATLTLWAALIAGALGVLVVGGWVFDIEALTRPIAEGSAMKLNIAIALILAAAALALSAQSQRSKIAAGTRSVLLLVVFAIAALTLVEYAFNVDVGIDQALVIDPVISIHSIPGRMSAITAVEFVLFAIALAAPDQRGGLFDSGFVAFTALGLLIAFIALMGYLFGDPLLYQPVPSTSIAVHSAAALAALFLGAAASRPRIGWMKLFNPGTVTARYARYLLPGAILAPVLLGFVILRGHVLDQYDVHTAVVLFTVTSAILFSSLIWAGGAYANRLGQALAQREDIYQTVAATAQDALVLMDQRGALVEWNPQAERVFGWSRAEAIGRPLAQTIIPEQRRDIHVSGLKQFLATGEHPLLRRLIEVTGLRRDGTTFPMEMIVVPMRLGEEWVFSGFLRDISGAKKAADQLRQAQKMEAVGQLSGGMAHDFNNLLTVVVGGIDSVLDRVSAEVRPRLETALQAGERGAALVRQLLAFSRRQSLRPARIDINAIAADMEELLRRTLGAQIDLKFEFGAEVWPAYADRGQVESALLNLAINARDAMPEGGTLTIETGNAELDAAYAALNAEVTPGEYTVLAVSDTGTGMSAEVLTRVFEPFFSTKDVGKGSGLGLSMVFGFAKQSKGHVKIYSELGQGTTVRLYLPRLVGEVGSDTPDVQTAAEAPIQGGEETLLIVEDDAPVRAFASAYLRALGYHVLEATTASEALSLLESETPIDLMFTDIMMPGELNGRRLAEQAWRTRPNLKVLFTSGYADASVINNGLLKAGAKFLSKPYKGGDLARFVRRILDGAA